MTVKPAIGFLSASSDKALAAAAQKIVNDLATNPDYPTPSPTLATVTTALNDFNVAVANATGGGKEETADQKRQARRARLASASTGQLRRRHLRRRPGETALERFPHVEAHASHPSVFCLRRTRPTPWPDPRPVN